MAATPKSQVRSPADRDDEDNHVGGDHDDGDDVADGTASDDYSDDHSRSASSMGTDTAEIDAHEQNHLRAAGGAVDLGSLRGSVALDAQGRKFAPQTISGWCALPMLLLAIICGGTAAALGLLSYGLADVKSQAAVNLAVRGVVTTAATVDALQTLRGVNSTSPVLVADTVAVANTLTSAQAAGDVVAVLLPPTTTGFTRRVPMQLTANPLASMLCPGCPDDARVRGEEPVVWWSYAPRSISGGILASRSRPDPALANSDSAMAVAAVNPKTVWGNNNYHGLTVSNNDSSVRVQYTVNHRLLTLATAGDSAFKYGVAAAAVMAIGLSFISILVAFELLDVLFERQWRRLATEAERDKIDRAENDGLDEDESDIADSITSSRSEIASQEARRTAVLTVTVFLIVALWTSSGVAVAFEPARFDARRWFSAASTSEAVLLTTALDSILIPVAATDAAAVAALNAAMSRRASRPRAIYTVSRTTSNDELQQLLPAAVATAQATTHITGSAYVNFTSDSVANDAADTAISESFGIGAAIGIAFGTAFLCAVATFALVGRLHAHPVGLRNVIRRTLATSDASVFLEVLASPAVSFSVAVLVALLVASAVAAGSVTMLRREYYAAKEVAVRDVTSSVALSPLGAGESAPLTVDTTLALKQLGFWMPASRHVYRTTTTLCDAAAVLTRLGSALTLIKSQNPPTVTYDRWNTSVDDVEAPTACTAGTRVGQPVPKNFNPKARALLAGHPCASDDATSWDVVAGWSSPDGQGTSRIPQGADLPPYGIWATPAAAASVSATSKRQIVFNDDTSLPRRDTTSGSVEFPSVVWIPLTVVACAGLFVFTLADFVFEMASSALRRGRRSESRVLVMAGSCLLLVLLLLVAWPAAAVATLRDAFGGLRFQAIDDEAAFAARLAVRTTIFTHYGTRLGAMTTDAQLVQSMNWITMSQSAGVASPRTQDGAATGAALRTLLRSPIRRRGGLVVLATPLGSPSQMGAAAAVVASTVARSTDTSCASDLSAAQLILCRPGALMALRQQAATAASSWAVGTSSPAAIAGVYGSGAVANISSGAIRYAYAAEFITPVNTSLAPLLVEAIIVIEGAAPSAIIESADGGAAFGDSYEGAGTPLQSLAVRVVAVVCVVTTAALVSGAFFLASAHSHAQYRGYRPAANRIVTLIGGFYKAKPAGSRHNPEDTYGSEDEDGKVKLLGPAMNRWSAARMPPLTFRRREVLSVLLFAVVILVGGAMTDLRLAYVRQQINVEAVNNGTYSQVAIEASGAVVGDTKTSASMTRIIFEETSPVSAAAGRIGSTTASVAQVLSLSSADPNVTSYVQNATANAAIAATNSMLRALAPLSIISSYRGTVTGLDADALLDSFSEAPVRLTALNRITAELFRPAATAAASALAFVEAQLAANSTAAVALFAAPSSTAPDAARTGLPWQNSFAFQVAACAEGIATAVGFMTRIQAMDASSPLGAGILVSLNRRLTRAAAAAVAAIAAADAVPSSSAAAPTAEVRAALSQVSSLCAQALPPQPYATAVAVARASLLQSDAPAASITVAGVAYGELQRRLAELIYLSGEYHARAQQADAVASGLPRSADTFPSWVLDGTASGSGIRKTTASILRGWMTGNMSTAVAASSSLGSCDARTEVWRRFGAVARHMAEARFTLQGSDSGSLGRIFSPASNPAKASTKLRKEARDYVVACMEAIAVCGLLAAVVSIVRRRRVYRNVGGMMGTMPALIGVVSAALLSIAVVAGVNQAYFDAASAIDSVVASFGDASVTATHSAALVAASLEAVQAAVVAQSAAMSSDSSAVANAVAGAKAVLRAHGAILTKQTEGASAAYLASRLDSVAEASALSAAVTTNVAAKQAKYDLTATPNAPSALQSPLSARALASLGVGTDTVYLLTMTLGSLTPTDGDIRMFGNTSGIANTSWLPSKGRDNEVRGTVGVALDRARGSLSSSKPFVGIMLALYSANATTNSSVFAARAAIAVTASMTAVSFGSALKELVPALRLAGEGRVTIGMTLRALSVCKQLQSDVARLVSIASSKLPDSLLGAALSTRVNSLVTQIAGSATKIETAAKLVYAAATKAPTAALVAQLSAAGTPAADAARAGIAALGDQVLIAITTTRAPAEVAADVDAAGLKLRNADPVEVIGATLLFMAAYGPSSEFMAPSESAIAAGVQVPEVGDFANTIRANDKPLRALADPETGATFATFLANTVNTDRVMPWWRVLGTVANSYSDPPLTTLATAEDTAQRVAAGGCWAIAFFAALVAGANRLGALD